MHGKILRSSLKYYIRLGTSSSIGIGLDRCDFLNEYNISSGSQSARTNEEYGTTIRFFSHGGYKRGNIISSGVTIHTLPHLKCIGLVSVRSSLPCIGHKAYE